MSMVGFKLATLDDARAIRVGLRPTPRCVLFYDIDTALVRLHRARVFWYPSESASNDENDKEGKPWKQNGWRTAPYSANCSSSSQDGRISNWPQPPSVHSLG